MSEELHKGAQPYLFHYARLNRRTETVVEKILWELLRNRNLNGRKFRRQHPIGDFIADFYCSECNLIVEVDGSYHSESDRKQYDEGRTYELSELKIRVIRFTNEEVLDDLDFVEAQILKHLRSTL